MFVSVQNWSEGEVFFVLLEGDEGWIRLLSAKNRVEKG